MMPQRARDRRGPGPTVALVLTLGLAATGCSFRFIKPAPARDTWPSPVLPESSEERCTDVVGLPVADTIIGTGLGTLTYIERHSGSPTITVGLGLATIPYVASAIYGYIQTSRCDRYKSLFRPKP
jgi:hypothetical protein